MSTRAVELAAAPLAEPLAARLRRAPHDGVTLYWLGQAGFLIRAAGTTILVDPYLSDSLAEKYRGTLFPHERLMAAPIAPEELGPVDLVLCTHHHTDHMDPGTLAPIARGSNARFVVPAASRDEAARRIGAGGDRLILVDAGDRVLPAPGVAVRAVPAAHETVERDSAGRHVFLGFGLEVAGMRVFHSGDAVPYPGLERHVRDVAADVALLPVNGRSRFRTENGVPGNFTLAEAIDVARACAIPHLIAHHYGMFAFNTIDRREIERAAERLEAPDLRPASLALEYRLSLV